MKKNFVRTAGEAPAKETAAYVMAPRTYWTRNSLRSMSLQKVTPPKPAKRHYASSPTWATNWASRCLASFVTATSFRR